MSRNSFRWSDAKGDQKSEGQSLPKPDPYEVVWLPPEARSLPGEYCVLRQINQRKTLGTLANGIARGTDFDPFEA